MTFHFETGDGRKVRIGTWCRACVKEGGARLRQKPAADLWRVECADCGACGPWAPDGLAAWQVWEIGLGAVDKPTNQPWMDLARDLAEAKASLERAVGEIRDIMAKLGVLGQ